MCLKSSVQILKIHPLRLLILRREISPRLLHVPWIAWRLPSCSQKAVVRHKTLPNHGDLLRGGPQALQAPSWALLPEHSVKGEGRSRSPLAMASPVAEIEAPLSPELVKATPEAITQPILAAIEDFKSILMVRVEHLASECTLIRHDLDKMKGRLTEAEGQISNVGTSRDPTHHRSQNCSP